MKRTKEITIIHYRRRRVKKSQAAEAGISDEKSNPPSNPVRCVDRHPPCSERVEKQSAPADSTHVQPGGRSASTAASKKQKKEDK